MNPTDPPGFDPSNAKKLNANNAIRKLCKMDSFSPSINDPKNKSEAPKSDHFVANSFPNISQSPFSQGLRPFSTKDGVSYGNN